MDTNHKVLSFPTASSAAKDNTKTKVIIFILPSNTMAYHDLAICNAFKFDHIS